MMTAQERVIAALEFRPPDRLPLYEEYWSEFTTAWRAAKGLGEEADICDYYEVDIAIAAADESLFPSRAEVLEQSEDRVVQRDGWGRVIETAPGTYFYRQLSVAISDPADLEQLEPESPEAESRYVPYTEAVESLKSKRCVFARVAGPFILSQFVRGEAEFLCDMAAEPAFAAELAALIGRHQTAIGLEILRRWDLAANGIWIADDFASNKGLHFSPRSAERILLPVWAEMIAAFKAAGARRVILHSDGNILELLDRLIEIGFDAIHPVEPRAGMDLPILRERYGDRLALLGGLDNAGVIPGGDPDDVRAHVRRVAAAGREGGVVIGMHSVGPDISVETYELVTQTIRRAT